MISIVIRTRNRAQLLKVALESVKAQSYKDYEIILVDDSSTDNTKEVIKEFDVRYFYHEHTKDWGAWSASKLGFSQVKGDFIAWLDDDDSYHPTFLEKSIEQFEDMAVGVTYTNTHLFGDGEKDRGIGNPVDLSKMSFLNQVAFAFVKAKGFIINGSIIYRRACYDYILSKLKEEDLYWWSDFGIYALLFGEFEFRKIDETLFNYYIHEFRSTLLPDKLIYRHRGVISTLNNMSRVYPITVLFPYLSFEKFKASTQEILAALLMSKKFEMLGDAYIGEIKYLGKMIPRYGEIFNDESLRWGKVALGLVERSNDLFDKKLGENILPGWCRNREI